MNNNTYTNIATALRMLSVDMVVNAGSGHQGMPLGMADIATVLFCNHLNFNTQNPHWINRDRFILSNGHGVALQYSLLYMAGYEDIKLEDIKNFRQVGSKAAGHPEYRSFDGIETTTGPLGQGFANAVGIALGQKILNKKCGKNALDFKVYCFCGDGDLMEGISYEAQSFAGKNQLNNLIAVFDNNQITIDGNVSLSRKENIKERFLSTDWNVIEIDGHNFKQIDDAFKKAKKETKRPTLIIANTIIGKFSEFAGEAKVHGNPINAEGREKIAKKLNWKYKPFEIPDDIICEFQKLSSRGQEKFDNFDKKSFDVFEKFYGDSYNEKQINSKLKKYISDIVKNKKDVSTRKAFGEVLGLVKDDIFDYVNGSADLTESNNFIVDDEYIRYGIREHFMAACSSGLSLMGFKSFCGTFLAFSDYMRPAIRLSCLMGLDVNYVFTHDSIGVGEDGPTHQPVEQLSGLRLVPNITVFRPCDAIEATQCLKYSLEIDTPKVFALSRQNLPVILDSKTDKVSYGAYAIVDCKKPSLIIMASGSEVQIALELAKDKKNVRVISFVSMELFEKQNEKYKSELLPKGVKKVAIEAGVTGLWYKYANQVFGIDTFGKSGKYKDIFEWAKLTYKQIKI